MRKKISGREVMAHFSVACFMAAEMFINILICYIDVEPMTDMPTYCSLTALYLLLFLSCFVLFLVFFDPV